jgi:hypothetical protein
LLTDDGFQVPVMAGVLVELVGSTGAGVPLQNAGGVVNVGVTGVFTVEFNIVVVAHCPAVGIKV